MTLVLCCCWRFVRATIETAGQLSSFDIHTGSGKFQSMAMHFEPKSMMWAQIVLNSKHSRRNFFANNICELTLVKRRIRGAGGSAFGLASNALQCARQECSGLVGG